MSEQGPEAGPGPAVNAPSLAPSPFHLQCGSCGKVCATAWNLRCHLSKKRGCAPPNQKKVVASKAFCCDDCGRSFSSRQSKYQHKKNHCKKNQGSGVEVQTEMERLRRRIADLEKSVKNVVITSNTTNNTTNFTINAYGREDVSHLTEPFLDQCVERTGKGLVELIQSIHFHPEKPENTNLRISNKKLPFIECNNGSKWIFERKDRVLSDLMEKGHDIMQNHFDDHEDRLSEKWSQTMYEHVKEWLENISEDRDKKVYDLLTDIYLLILNSA